MLTRLWSLLPPALLAVLLAGCAAPPSPPLLPAGQGELAVELSGFRSDRGQVLVSLFAAAGGFPDEPERALRNQSVPIRDSRAVVAFTGLPWGRYALSVLHDENADGRMETGLFGIPKEGFAVSGNREQRFSAPAFAEAAFELRQERLCLALRLRYLERRGPFSGR